jgi:rod shape-determining protein MreC
MKTIFNHGPSPQHRLIMVLCFSALLVYIDHNLRSFEAVRGYLQSMVSPLQYLANSPKQMISWASENVVTRRQLMSENQQYKKETLRLHEQLLQLDIVQQENQRLRSLLASPLRSGMKKMVTEILSVDSDPYTQQVVINRGTSDGVYEGQPLLDEKGIVGQIVTVGANSSRVLLITDVTHGVPVRVKRNGIRLIASGNGQIDRLIHNHVPHSADIRQGDILVSSGLGGKYPEGYPVAKVIQVSLDESRPFAQIYSQPIAQIDRLRYLLLLWPEKTNNIFAPKPLEKQALSSRGD